MKGNSFNLSLYSKAIGVFYYLSIFYFPCSLIGQEDLTKDKTYFENQLLSYENWMHNNELDQIFSIDSMKVNPDHLVLFLGSAYEGKDSFSTDFLRSSYTQLKETQKEIQKKGVQQPFEHRMFKTFSFIMGIKRTQAKIHIRGKDYEEFYLIIEHDGKSVTIDKKYLSNEMGTGDFELDVSEMDFLKKTLSDTINSKDIQKVRLGIEEYFNETIKDKGTLIYDPVVVNKSYSGQIIYRVEKIKNLVLKDGYFEKLEIEINLFKSKQKVKVFYDIIGSYSNGLLWAPRESAYEMMDVGFPGELEKFEKELILDIKKYLNNKHDGIHSKK